MCDIWFDKYCLINNEEYDNSNINNLITKLSNKIEDKSINNKINKIEREYEEKIEEIQKLFDNKKMIEEIKQSNSLKILQKELEIIKLLTKYTLQNKNINLDFFESC